MSDSEDPNDWTSLLVDVDSTLASMYAELLTSEGIAVAVRDDVRGSLFGVIGTVPKELLVHSGDVEKARQILDDWSKAEPVPGDAQNE